MFNLEKREIIVVLLIVDLLSGTSNHTNIITKN